MPKIALMMMSALFVSMTVTADAVSKVPAGTISRITGAADSVAVSNTGEPAPRAAQTGDQLFPSDTLTTDKDQSVTIALLDGSELVVAPESSFKVDSFTHPQLPRKTILGLVYGTLRALVKRVYSGEDQFVIIAPRALMGVRGTHFIVKAARDSGDTELHVLEGKVAMSLTLEGLNDSKARVLVPAGKRAGVSAAAPSLPKPRPFDRVKYRGELLELSPDFEHSVGPDAPAQEGDGTERRSLHDALEAQHAQNDENRPPSDDRHLRGGLPVGLQPGLGSPGSQPAGMGAAPAAANAINPSPLNHPGAVTPGNPGQTAPPGATNSRPTVGAGATTQTPPSTTPKTK